MRAVIKTRGTKKRGDFIVKWRKRGKIGTVAL
jgi:hypothetical protein